VLYHINHDEPIIIQSSIIIHTFKNHEKKHMKITGLFLSEAQRLIHGGTFRGISPQSQLRQLLWNW
jgi:hypothetical protein